MGRHISMSGLMIEWLAIWHLKITLESILKTGMEVVKKWYWGTGPESLEINLDKIDDLPIRSDHRMNDVWQ